MYPDVAQQQTALAAFCEESGLFHGPPIPRDAVTIDGLGVALDYERATEMTLEWTGLLDQVAALTIGANAGELIATYDGWSESAGGRKVQRVRLRPGLKMDDPDEAPVTKATKKPTKPTKPKASHETKTSKKTKSKPAR